MRQHTLPSASPRAATTARPTLPRGARLRRAVLALAGAVALAGGGACGDFLSPRPTDVLTPENFYRTSADAVAATNAVYEQTKWSYWLAFWYVSDVATDQVLASPNFGGDGQRASSYTFDAREWFVGDIWTNAYRTVNRANAAIGRVPSIAMEEGLRARLVAEARFLRANAYFNLVRFFGDVPLLTEEVTSLEGLRVARTPAAQVYQTIVADLEAAAAALPASYGGGEAGRATSGAARALLARVRLTQRDWNAAAQAAGAVVQSGRYRLAPDFRDVFRVATELQNPENIFSINYDATLDPGAGSVVTLFTLPSGFPGGDAYGLVQVLPSSQARFAAEDRRGLGATFITSPYTDALGRRVTWGVPAGAALVKYLDQSNTQNMTARGWTQQANDWKVLRYADVLLMYAEAVNEGGSPAGGLTAEAALNQVRARAGIAPVSGLSQAAFRDTVRVERLRELFFEGHRWFDLARWGILNERIRAKQEELARLNPGSVTPRGVPGTLLPIPQGEINVNPLLTQNPGW